MTFAIQGQGQVDGLVPDHALVADLDPERVEEDHRIDRIEWPVLPFPHLVEDGVGDPADQVGRDVDGIEFAQVALDLADRHAPGVQRDDLVVEAVQAALALGHDLRFEAAVAITRHVDLHHAVLGQHRLGIAAVAVVAGPPADGITLSRTRDDVSARLPLARSSSAFFSCLKRPSSPSRSSGFS